MDKTKQILRVIQKQKNLLHEKNQVNLAKEITTLYKDYYPKEFVEWIYKKCIIKFGTFYVSTPHSQITIDSFSKLFQYWQDNVIERKVPKSDNIPPECRECGKMNSENCNTCPVLHPQYEPC